MITDAIKKVSVISAGFLIVSVIVGEVLGISIGVLIVPYIKAVYGILILVVLIDIAISLEKISAKPKE
jgi:hypothetical protein